MCVQVVCMWWFTGMWWFTSSVVFGGTGMWWFTGSVCVCGFTGSVYVVVYR